MPEFVRVKDLHQKYFPTLSRTSFWRLRKDPGFPKKITVAGIDGYLADQVREFLEKRAA